MAAAGDKGSIAEIVGTGAAASRASSIEIAYISVCPIFGYNPTKIQNVSAHGLKTVLARS